MAHTRAWNAAYEIIQEDGTDARLLGGTIRNLKVDIRERMALDHKWDPTAADADKDGTHNKVTLNQLVALTAPSAGQTRIGALDSGGIPEIYWRDPSSGLAQLTKAGKLKLLSNINEFVAGNSVTPVTLTDGATVTIDCALGNVFVWEIGGNRTLANPTNPKNGQVITILIRQDGTGSRTVTYGAKWFFPNGIDRQIDPNAGFVTTVTAIFATAFDAWLANIAHMYV